MYVPSNGGVNIYGYILFENIVDVVLNVKCWSAPFVFDAILSILLFLMSFSEILWTKQERSTKPARNYIVKILL